jgi:hypothetical protein
MSKEDISVVPEETPEAPPPRKCRCWCRWLRRVLLGIVVVVVVGGGALYWQFFLRVYRHELCQSAMQAIAADKDLRELVGMPFATIKWPSREVAPAARIEEREVDLMWHIEGSRSRAKVHAQARLRDGKWQTIILTVELPGQKPIAVQQADTGDEAAPFCPQDPNTPAKGTKSGPKVSGPGPNVDVPMPPDDPSDGAK